MPAPREATATFGPADCAPRVAARPGVALDLVGAAPARHTPATPHPDVERPHRRASAGCHARTAALLAAANQRLAASRAARAGWARPIPQPAPALTLLTR